MATYCTADDIASFLAAYGFANLRPEALEGHAALAESQIDAVAYTCWGKSCLSDLETHSLTLWLGGVWLGAGIPIHLRYRPVRRLVRFEVFNGQAWVDMLRLPEGRITGAWWCDYEYGVCFLNTLWWWQGGREIRIQYEYGHATVPHYVRTACTLMAARSWLATERNRLSLVESEEAVRFDELVRMIDEWLRPLMDRIRGVGIPTALD